VHSIRLMDHMSWEGAKFRRVRALNAGTLFYFLVLVTSTSCTLTLRSLL